MRNKLPLLLILSLLWLVPNAQAVPMFGFDVAPSSFSDNATHVSGDINYLGFSKDGLPITGDDDIDLDTALNGPDLYAFIEGIGDSSTKSPYVIDVDFLDNSLFNGFGVDLLIWERGFAEPVGVALFDPRFNTYTPTIIFTSIKVGDLVDSVDVSSGVNVASINFDSWSIPSDVMINKIRLFGGPGGDPSADVAAINGLNSIAIPEPSTFLLLGLGILGFALRRKIS